MDGPRTADGRADAAHVLITPRMLRRPTQNCRMTRDGGGGSDRRLSKFAPIFKSPPYPTGDRINTTIFSQMKVLFCTAADKRPSVKALSEPHSSFVMLLMYFPHVGV